MALKKNDKISTPFESKTTNFIAESIIKNGEYSVNTPTKKIYGSKGACVRLGTISGVETTVFQADGLMPFYTRFGITSEKHIQNSLKTSLLSTNTRLSELFTLFDNVLFSTKNIRGETTNRVGLETDAIGYIQTDNADNLFGIVEFKTSGYLPKDPEPKYLSQIRIYQSVLPFPVFLDYQPREIRKRGAFLHKTFVIKYDFDEVLKKATDIFKIALYQDEELLPPTLPSSQKHICKSLYCDFYSLCWGYANNKERILNSFEKLSKPDDNKVKSLNNKARKLAEEFLSDKEYSKRLEYFVENILVKDKNIEVVM